MERIIAQVTVQNALDLNKSMKMSALVDTGAAYLSLPIEWFDKFGESHDAALCAKSSFDSIPPPRNSPKKLVDNASSFAVIFGL